MEAYLPRSWGLRCSTKRVWCAFPVTQVACLKLCVLHRKSMQASCCACKPRRRLLTVLHRLVDGGNSVLVIEHNLDVIYTSDWVIELGPEGGDGGGIVVGTGTPEDIAKLKNSHTGRFLKPLIASNKV